MELDHNWWRGTTEESPPAREVEEEDQSYQPSVHAGFEKDSDTYFKFRSPFGCERLVLEDIDPPPKKKPTSLAAKNQGWRYLQYIPEWTDPSWQDPSLYRRVARSGRAQGQRQAQGQQEQDGEQEQDGNQQQQPKQVGNKSDDYAKDSRPIRNLPLLRILRPAQLATDAAHNPTPFARRFGIHPGRTDGRSRLSPTSDVRRQLPLPEGSNRPPTFVTATAVLDQLKQLARAQNRDAEDLLQELAEPANFARLGKNDQFMVQFLTSIYDDYDWQSLIFADMTTDEIMRDGLFAIDNQFPGMNLDVPLHPLVQRNRWKRLCNPGHSKQFSLFMYNIGGRRGVLDPGTDDFVWERLQPALKLVTLIINQNLVRNPRWNAYMNVFNRRRVNLNRDRRPFEQTVEAPAWSFSTAKVPPEELPAYAELLSKYIDPIATTWNVILKHMIINIDSVWHMEGDPGRTGSRIEGSMALSRVRGRPVLAMRINADIIYPLLVEGYSVSEQVECQFKFADKFLHELSHAVNHAHYLWTHTPGPRHYRLQPIQPFRDDTLESVERFGRSLYNETGPWHRQPQVSIQMPEPFGDDMPVAEAGFWAQDTVFGGCTWSTIGLTLNARFLVSVPSGTNLENFPRSFMEKPTAEETAKLPTKNVLEYPPLPWEDYRRTIRASQLRAFFDQNFWTAEVTRYGDAAFLLGASPNAKIYATDITHHTWSFMKLSLLKHTPKGVFTRKDYASFVLLFLLALHAEVFEVFLMDQRWKADEQSLKYRDRALDAVRIECRLDGLHLATAYLDSAKSNRLSAEELDAWRHEHYMGCVDAAATCEQYAEQNLGDTIVRWPVIVELLDGRFEEFWNVIPSPTAADAAKRLGYRLRTAHTQLMREVGTYQSFLAGLWRLSDHRRAQFLSSSRRRAKICSWLAKLDRHCDSFIQLSSQHFLQTVITPMAHEFLDVREKIRSLKTAMAADLHAAPSGDWGESLSLLPKFRHSKRSISKRWIRTAQKEIRLLTNEQIKNVDKLLRVLRAHSNATAAALVDSMVTDPLEAVNQLVEHWTSSKYAFLDDQEPFPPGLSMLNPGPDLDPQGSDPPSVPASGEAATGTSSSDSPADHAAQGGTAPNTAVDNTSPHPISDLENSDQSPDQQQQGLHHPPGQKRFFKLKAHVKELPGLNHPTLPHAQPFSSNLLAPQHPQPTYPNLPTGLSGQWSGPPSVPTPIPPAVHSPWLDYGSNIPAHRGLFPHPYALKASVTDDLVHQVAQVVSGGQDAWRVPDNNPAFHTLQQQGVQDQDESDSSGSSSSSDSDDLGSASALFSGLESIPDSDSDSDDDDVGDGGGATTGGSGGSGGSSGSGGSGGAPGGASDGVSDGVSGGSPRQNQGGKKRKCDEDDHGAAKKQKHDDSNDDADATKKHEAGSSKKRKRDDDGGSPADKRPKTANIINDWSFKWPTTAKAT